MSIPSPRSLTIWRLIDGKPGHEKQTRGLVAALARQGPVECLDIPVGSRPGHLLDWLTGRFPAGAGLPDPDLILGAGHATHLALLAARRARGGRSVVLMGPSLPRALFDLCLIPEHDCPPGRDNVIATRGVLNPLVNEHRHQAGQGLILIGGPSPHFRWDSSAIRHQVEHLVQTRPGLAWQLTTSRRTPEDFLAGLASREGFRCLPVQETPPGWLDAQMGEAGEAWCTPDSVSMVFEALTAGCRVGLFDLPPVAGSRVAAGVEKLRPLLLGRDGDVQSVDTLQLDEAGRCAALIRERWFR